MKKTIPIILAAVLTMMCLYAKAQITKDACTLITDEQINKIIGCKVTQSGTAIMKGKRCVHKSADFKADITLEYYDWHTEKTAKDMLKRTFDDNKKDISEGKKAVGIYTSFKEFPAGGQYAFIMTGAGDTYSNGNVVRLEFLIGTAVLTLDTRGIDMSKVVPNLDKIYSIIKTNY